MLISLRVLLLTLVAGTAVAGDVRVVERIIAKVNGDIITTSELERGRRQLEAELRQRGLSGAVLQKEIGERAKDLLRDRIDNLLLVQKAKELNINVDSEVTKQLADIQRRNKIADQDKFHDWIREQYGMPFEDFRQEVRNSEMTRRLIGQEVTSNIAIPSAETRKYYDEHQSEFTRDARVFLSEILISTAGKDEKQVSALEKKAKALVERARAGERFSDLARDNSDADSASDNGQLSSFPRNQLDPQIAEIVFAQEKGYVTDPIRRSNGFLILRVDQKHTAGLASFEEVESEITQKLLEPRFEPAIRAYLTRLRTDAFVEIREGFLDSGAAPGKETRWQDPAQLKPETVTKEEVASRIRRKRLLWLVPTPFMEMTVSTAKSSSK